MIELLIALVVLGLIVWFVETYIPMAEPFKVGVRILAAIIVLVMILSLFGYVDLPMRAPLFRR